MESNSARSKEIAHVLTTEKFSPVLKIPAVFVSYIFHPLFIPLIGAWYLTFVQPGFFAGISSQEKYFILIRVAYNTIFFPALTILLLKGLGFIDSIFLRTKQERIIPYIAANIFYFWMYLVFRNQDGIPPILTAFIFGIFLSSSLALLANIYFKISMHALGVGALTGLMLNVVFSSISYSVFLPAMVIIILTGVVATARMIVSDHTPFDIYSGLFIGIVTQLIAIAFLAL
ncbi:MAG: hypothetical protein ABIO82_01400 [Ginsengibacter sp.]